MNKIIHSYMLLILLCLLTGCGQPNKIVATFQHGLNEPASTIKPIDIETVFIQLVNEKKHIIELKEYLSSYPKTSFIETQTLTENQYSDLSIFLDHKLMLLTSILSSDINKVSAQLYSLNTSDPGILIYSFDTIPDHLSELNLQKINEVVLDETLMLLLGDQLPPSYYIQKGNQLFTIQGQYLEDIDEIRILIDQKL